MKQLLTRFWRTRSPGLGTASTLNALPGWSGCRGDEGSVDMCLTWMTGRLLERHALFHPGVVPSPPRRRVEPLLDVDQQQDLGIRQAPHASRSLRGRAPASKV